MSHGLKDIVMEDTNKKDKRNPTENCQTTRNLAFFLSVTGHQRALQLVLDHWKQTSARWDSDYSMKKKVNYFSQSLLCHK